MFRRGVRFRQDRKLAQDDRPLGREANLRHRRDRSSDDDARKPGVEKTNSLDIGPRQYGAKGAAEYVGGAQEEQEELDPEVASLIVDRSLAQPAMEQQQQGDVRAADDDQKTPPDRNRV